MTETAQIYSALVKAAQAMEPAVKSGQMGKGGGGYTYATESDVIHAVREHLLANGISVYPSNQRDVGFFESQSDNGTVWYHAKIQTDYIFAHEDGSFIRVASYGWGSDFGDKALNKAMTGAFKYALIQTCLLPRGDDPDHTSSEEMQGSGVSRRQGENVPACPRHGTQRMKRRVPGGGPYRGQDVYECGFRDRETKAFCNWTLPVDEMPEAPRDDPTSYGDDLPYE